ncbi:MAG: carboxypeptidase M32, partial [Candidatus Thorarchaeota archaeon]
MMSAYEQLLSKVKELSLIGSAAGIIHWDLETYMPPGAIMLRSEQLATLSKIIHRMTVDPEIGKLLDAAENDKDSVDELAQRNLYLLRKSYDQQTKLPERLVADLSRQQAISVETWKKAKAANDWKMFEPELQKMIDLSIEKAEILKDIKGTSSIYDTLIDDFEPKMKADDISRAFSELRDGLVPLTEKYAEKTSGIDRSFLNVPIPIELQRKIAIDLSDVVGYDTTSEKANGRIDEVEHPFTTGYFSDVRITVKYHLNNFSSAVFAILHEAGHALYEQNFNPDWIFQPIGSACGMGIHESQSRFIENMIGRSPEFWKFYLPRLNGLTNNAFSNVKLDDFVRAINIVQPSKIRIEADEVTYSLHIIIRFEIERDLFAGKIEISELPDIWRQKYEEYLGIKIETDAEGVLQDTHWASGYYGYFPSYALGNVYDGLWYDQMKQDMPNWVDNLARGEIIPAVNWHKEHVHRWG